VEFTCWDKPRLRARSISCHPERSVRAFAFPPRLLRRAGSPTSAAFALGRVLGRTRSRRTCCSPDSPKTSRSQDKFQATTLHPENSTTGDFPVAPASGRLFWRRPRRQRIRPFHRPLKNSWLRYVRVELAFRPASKSLILRTRAGDTLPIGPLYSLTTEQSSLTQTPSSHCACRQSASMKPATRDSRNPSDR